MWVFFILSFFLSFVVHDRIKSTRPAFVYQVILNWQIDVRHILLLICLDLITYCIFTALWSVRFVTLPEVSYSAHLMMLTGMSYYPECCVRVPFIMSPLCCSMREDMTGRMNLTLPHHHSWLTAARLLCVCFCLCVCPIVSLCVYLYRCTTQQAGAADVQHTHKHTNTQHC